MACPVCTHPKRADIERELMARNLADSVSDTESIAKKYGLKFIDVQVHAMTHRFLPTNDGANADPAFNGSIDDETIKPTTFVDAIQYREAIHLREVISEYSATAARVGAAIRVAAKSHSSDNPSLYKVPKAVVDLYVSCGNIVSDAVLNLAKVNNMIGNDADPGTTALAGLVKAITASEPLNDTTPITTPVQVSAGGGESPDD